MREEFQVRSLYHIREGGAPANYAPEPTGCQELLDIHLILTLLHILTCCKTLKITKKFGFMKTTDPYNYDKFCFPQEDSLEGA